MIRRLAGLTAALAALVWIAAPQSAIPQSAVPLPSGENDVILRSMQDEMERSRQLRIVSGGDVPYFFSYGLTDTDSFRVVARLGAAVSVNRNRFRSPIVEVRVGSYDFDNTGHVYSGYSTGSHYTPDFPLDDQYQFLRDCWWLATDHAFKTALESMTRKRAALNNAAESSDKLADFSKVEPVQSIAKLVHRKVDESTWTARTVKLSGLFKSYPDVMTSGVEFTELEGVTYLVNSEGTTVRYDDSLAAIYATAEGQAPDGLMLHDAVSIQELEAGKMPSEADLIAGVSSVAQNIRALTHAPMGESFSGPVLFEPEAAAQLLAQMLGDNLNVPRKPLAEPGRTVNFLPSELETKIGSRILPEFINVTDDATQSSWHGKPLAGFYPFDLEGVAPKPVTVIEKGVLKNFLTTREPIKGFTSSNGHARLPGSYGARNAAIGNLFVTATQSAPLASLKQKLIDMCKERGKPYGMLVRKLDYPFSSGAQELRELASASAQSGGSVRPISPPVLLYRVYPDGHEELVRGLRFRGLSTRSLRDVLAASTETALFEYTNNSAPLAMLGSGGYLAPAAVVSPALLFDEIEFERPQDQLPKAPVVPAPTRGE